jgi:hypothetical protein
VRATWHIAGERPFNRVALFVVIQYINGRIQLSTFIAFKTFPVRFRACHRFLNFWFGCFRVFSHVPLEVQIFNLTEKLLSAYGMVAFHMVCQLVSTRAAFATISTLERPLVFVHLHMELELHGGGENDLAPSVTA